MSEPVTKTAPAIGYSFVANLADDRQLTVQCFVGEDEDDSAVNGKFDRIMGFIDRLKAKSEIPKLRKELEQHEKSLAQMKEDIARIENDFQSAQATFDVQLNTLDRRAEETFTDAEAEFRKSGRVGTYQPQGQAKANIQRIKQEMASLQAEKDKNAAERDAALSNIAVTQKRFEEEIARLRAAIAEREKVT